MQERITLDLDFKNKYIISFLLAIIEFNSNTRALMIEPSVKKGFHVTVWLKKPVTNRKHFELRKYWKDDKNRIKLDMKRLRRNEPINILFTNKTDFYYKHKR